MQDLLPEILASRRKVREAQFDLKDEIFSERPSQELLHIPGVLKASGVELEKDQVGGPHYEVSTDGLSPLQDPRLPGELSDHDVDRSLAWGLEPHDAGEGIGQVPLPDLDGDAAALQVGPEIRSQTGSIGGEQVEVEARAVHSVGG
ncbi:MAG TPA: hypothetical protein VIA62_18445 [Thermoanaerobaculia bacterium]|nr:hypothetical protein [Thermoanaerobaculia bacterium]